MQPALHTPVLQTHGLTRHIGPRTLYSGVTFSVHRGEVLGIVGANGSGKSTLLSLVAGSEHPDGGSVHLAPGSRVARLRQSPEVDASEDAGTRFPALFPNAIANRLARIAEELAADSASTALTEASSERSKEALTEPLVEEYERLLAILARPDAETRAVATRTALGLDHLAADTPLDAVSGGELTKLLLVEALGSEVDLLLLDEPTNHLDLPGIRWLEAALEAFAGAVLLVSHDRALLDRVATRLLILGRDGEAPEVFAGNYSAWVAERERRLSEQHAAFGRQQRDERRLRDHLAQLESRSRYIENSTTNFAIRKKAKKIARRSTTMKRRLEREAGAVTRVERPREAPGGVRTTFASVTRSASRLVEFQDVTLAVGGRALLEGIDLALERGEQVAVVGPNGAGKTTMLRAILGELAPAAGVVATAGSAVVGYLSQDEALAEAGAFTPLELLRREADLDAVAAGNLLHRVLPGHDQTATPIAHLSYGERRRLALALLMIRGCNVLLLDEPTNHLDMPSRESVEAALAGYEGAVLAVTHDRAFIAAAATHVWSIEDGRIVERAPEEITRER